MYVLYIYHRQHVCFWLKVHWGVTLAHAGKICFMGDVNGMHNLENVRVIYISNYLEVVYNMNMKMAFLMFECDELISHLQASSTTLYMPEPDDAVAHGDANLAVNDFFTRTSS